ncbi:hypothetical protein BDV23DRAFT_168217 [Aspergillus alliaceus]|uniref:FAD-binding domain-containing protein n=1 Tax=Petromyces alliaceus TaxID=209559 RepID=A0A5N7CQD7_PETAA|nr:hypothetical protein BDV23DRAFT_168217 [Aspergillus alliaceus]
MEVPRFKVIVVGGSIAGLTLAHCLYKAGIDCIVLEKRHEIAPQEGASVAILPNGGRILAQLGLYDAVAGLIEPLYLSHVRYPDGFHFTSDYPTTLQQRFGFGLAFVERQQLLQILYSFFPQKASIHTNKAVVRLTQLEGGAVAVYTQDGSCYAGDMVVGADGIHSCVRTEMWRLADLRRPGLVTKQEKSGLTAEYACIFGISSTIPGLKVGHQITSVDKGRSIIVVPARHGRLFWFVVLKLDTAYRYDSAPRFSPPDAAKLCEQLKDLLITEKIDFGRLWLARETYSVTLLEENVFQTWHFGRIVCIGDNMHKMTPNLGQGANCAIEDAAALANELHRALGCASLDHQLSDMEIDGLLDRFSKMQFARVRRIFQASRIVVRMHTSDNPLYRLVLRYYVPYAGKKPMELMLKLLADATALCFIPLPQRCGAGWPKLTCKEKRVRAWTWASSLVILVVLSLFPSRDGGM